MFRPLNILNILMPSFLYPRVWGTAIAGAGLALSAFGMSKSSKAAKAQARAMKESARGQAKIKRKQAKMMREGAEFDKTTAGYNMRLMDVEGEWADYWTEWDVSQLENARQGTATEMSAAIEETKEQAKRSTAELTAKLAAQGGDLLSVSAQSAFIDAGIQTAKAVADLRYEGWNQQAEILAQKGVLSLKAEYDSKLRVVNKAVYQRETDQNFKTANQQADLVTEEAGVMERTGIASSQAQASINRAQSFANFGSLALQGAQVYNTYSASQPKLGVVSGGVGSAKNIPVYTK